MKQATTNQIEFSDYFEEVGVETVRGKNVEHFFARHTHRHCCIGLVETGAWEIGCRGKLFEVHPGQIYLVPPGEKHSCRTLGNTLTSYKTIMISDSLFAAAGLPDSRPKTMQRLFTQIVIEDKVLYNHALSLHCLLTSKEPWLVKQMGVITFLGEIIALYLADFSTADDDDRLHSHEAFIRQAQRYIDENYSYSITLQELAQVANTSPYHLLRLFSDIVGVPPHVYQQQVRIRRAKQMLSDGEAIVDVAFSTGFADQSHFTKTFKKFVGVTPKQYHGEAEVPG